MALYPQLWELDDEEQIVFVILAIGAVVGTVHWVKFLSGRPLSQPSAAACRRLRPAPLWGLAIIYIAIHLWADREQVAGHFSYELLFTIGGVVWMLGFVALTPLAGMSLRRDVLECGNLAAATALAGAILGIAFAYGGANIGAGPTIWTTFIPAALGAGAFLGLWIGLALSGGSSELVTVERDATAGLRACGFLIGAGLILGRALAGDFTGYRAMLLDFVGLGWPALVLMGAAAGFDRLARPTPRTPHPSPWWCGRVPASLYVLAGAAWALWKR